MALVRVFWIYPFRATLYPFKTSTMKKILYLIIAATLLTSCGTARKIFKTSKTESKTEQLKETKTDVSSVSSKEVKEYKETTTPIEKTSRVSLKTGEPDIDKRINQALRNFKYTERSGKNSLGLKYDEKVMELVFKAFVTGSQATTKETSQDKSSEVNTETSEQMTVEQRIEDYVYKKVTRLPWWFYAFIYFFFLDAKVTTILSSFIPGLKGKNTILSIFGLFMKKR